MRFFSSRANWYATVCFFVPFCWGIYFCTKSEQEREWIIDGDENRTEAVIQDIPQKSNDCLFFISPPLFIVNQTLETLCWAKGFHERRYCTWRSNYQVESLLGKRTCQHRVHARSNVYWPNQHENLNPRKDFCQLFDKERTPWLIRLDEAAARFALILQITDYWMHARAPELHLFFLSERLHHNCRQKKVMGAKYFSQG